MRQNDLYEQKRRWQRIFLFFFLLFLTGVLIPGGCASEGKKSQSGKKGDPRDPSAQVLQTEASGEVTYMEMTWLYWMHPIRQMAM